LFLLHLFAVSPGSPQESQTPQAGSIVAGVAKVSTTATGEPPPIPDPIPVPTESLQSAGEAAAEAAKS